jgi:hypothetical protein
MERVFVTNEFVNSCCGLPREKCRCRAVTTNAKKPEPLPGIDWNGFFGGGTPANEPQAVANAQPKIAAVGAEWEF